MQNYFYILLRLPWLFFVFVFQYDKMSVKKYIFFQLWDQRLDVLRIANVQRVNLVLIDYVLVHVIVVQTRNVKLLIIIQHVIVFPDILETHKSDVSNVRKFHKHMYCVTFFYYILQLNANLISTAVMTYNVIMDSVLILVSWAIHVQQMLNVLVKLIKLLVDVRQATKEIHLRNVNALNVILTMIVLTPGCVYSSVVLIHVPVSHTQFVPKMQFVAHKIIEPFVFVHHIYRKAIHYLTAKQPVESKINQNANSMWIVQAN